LQVLMTVLGVDFEVLRGLSTSMICRFRHHVNIDIRWTATILVSPGQTSSMSAGIASILSSTAPSTITKTVAPAVALHIMVHFNQPAAPQPHGPAYVS
jgi:hypothetical protein